MRSAANRRPFGGPCAPASEVRRAREMCGHPFSGPCTVVHGSGGDRVWSNGGSRPCCGRMWRRGETDLTGSVSDFKSLGLGTIFLFLLVFRQNWIFDPICLCDLWWLQAPPFYCTVNCMNKIYCISICWICVPTIFLRKHTFNLRRVVSSRCKPRRALFSDSLFIHAAKRAFIHAWCLCLLVDRRSSQ